MTSPVRRARAEAVLAHVDAHPGLIYRLQWPDAPLRRDGLLFEQLANRGLTRREVDLALDDLTEAGRITLGVEDGYVVIRRAQDGPA